MGAHMSARLSVGPGASLGMTCERHAAWSTLASPIWASLPTTVSAQTFPRSLIMGTVWSSGDAQVGCPSCSPLPLHLSPLIFFPEGACLGWAAQRAPGNYFFGASDATPEFRPLPRRTFTPVIYLHLLWGWIFCLGGYIYCPSSFCTVNPPPLSASTDLDCLLPHSYSLWRERVFSHGAH